MGQSMIEKEAWRVGSAAKSAQRKNIRDGRIS